MTIYSEINIAKQLLKIFKSYEARIAALEEK
jgi:PTS system cellobiose-specific IIA component